MRKDCGAQAEGRQDLDAAACEDDTARVFLCALQRAGADLSPVRSGPSLLRRRLRRRGASHFTPPVGRRQPGQPIGPLSSCDAQPSLPPARTAFIGMRFQSDGLANTALSMSVRCRRTDSTGVRRWLFLVQGVDMNQSLGGWT